MSSTTPVRAPAAFYAVSDARYFLGAVGMINSLRLCRHREPIYVLDCGLEDQQRQAIEHEVTIVPMPRGGDLPSVLKTVAPLAHPAETMVLIDTDLVVTRSLAPLIERAAEGRLLAFENNVDRFVPEWGRLLELGEVRRRPYLCAALVAMGAEPGDEVLRLISLRANHVIAERTRWRGDVPYDPFRYGDQDVLNAVLASRVQPERVVQLAYRLAPMPPFVGLELIDEHSLSCAYEDGVAPYVVHHTVAKRWSDPLLHGGIYSRLLLRALNGDDVAIRLPRRMLPPRMRTGPLGYLERERENAGHWLRRRGSVLRHPLATREGALPAARHPTGDRRQSASAGQYRVGQYRYFRARCKELIRLAPRPLLDIARAVREAYRRIGYRRARWPRPFGTRPPITMAVCAIFRDEARYLAEWVTFHRLQGVERFYLYDNLSTDDWRSELGPEIAAGIVEVSTWREVPGQTSAYEDCLRRHRTDTRWIAFIDIDEFLFSPTGRPLPELMRGFDTHPGVVVNWRIYGTNGWEHPPDGLVIDNYPLRAPDDHPANRLVKSIVYPRSTLGTTKQPAHYFRLRGNPVGEDRRPALQHTREPATTDLLRINHYYAKSEEEFRRKAARPRADHGVITDRFPPPAAAVDDDSIMRSRPQLATALAARGVSPPPPCRRRRR